ncbi:MAG: DUF2188 domain-containing protein [Actinomycetota bacterium]|nr:DUF2188 domain-containing protein [Actinomycetota bacterium]
MGTKKGSAEEAADKTLGWIGETAGRIQGDRTLEAEGRTARRMGERKTYFVSAHDDGGWKVQAEGASRATSVHKTKGEAVASGKELARSRPPSQLLVYKQDGAVQEEQTYR